MEQLEGFHRRTVSLILLFNIYPKTTVRRYELINESDQTKYKVGEGFHTCRYTVRCYFEDGTTEDYSGDQLDITANGVPMYENYVFRTPGVKKIVISFGDFRRTSTLTVEK